MRSDLGCRARSGGGKPACGPVEGGAGRATVASFRNFATARNGKPSPASGPAASGPGVPPSPGLGGGCGGSGPSSRPSPSPASRSFARSTIARCRSRLAAVAYRRQSDSDRDSSNIARSAAPARSSTARPFRTRRIRRASFARSEPTIALSFFASAAPVSPSPRARAATAFTQSSQSTAGSPKPCSPAAMAAANAPFRAGSSNHEAQPDGGFKLNGRGRIRPITGCSPAVSGRSPSSRTATNRLDSHQPPGSFKPRSNSAHLARSQATPAAVRRKSATSAAGSASSGRASPASSVSSGIAIKRRPIASTRAASAKSCVSAASRFRIAAVASS